MLLLVTSTITRFTAGLPTSFQKTDEISGLVPIAQSLGYQTPINAPSPQVYGPYDEVTDTPAPEPFLTLAFTLNYLSLDTAISNVGAAIAAGLDIDLSVEALASDLDLLEAGSGFSRRFLCNVTEGKPAAACSVLDIYNTEARGHEDRLNMGGMGNFVLERYRHIPVHLGTRVEQIDWSGAGVRLSTSTGTVDARTVIVTAPMGVLARGALRFTPALPAAYEAAFHQLPMGVLDKIFLEFDQEVFAGLDANTPVFPTPDDPNGPLIISRLYDTNLCLVFAGAGQALALESQGERAMVEFGLDAVAAVAGTRARTAFSGRALATRWANDPNTFGAYTAAVVGGTAARAQLRIPVADRIHFAGEAASSASHSTVWGAYESGLAAAENVARTLAA